MKKFLLILGLMFTVICCSAQHTYIAQIKDIDNVDTTKTCIQIFQDLRASNIEYSQQTKTFSFKTKTFLSKLIVEDYFTSSGYTIITFFETGKSSQIIVLPTVKDTTKQKSLKIFRK